MILTSKAKNRLSPRSMNWCDSKRLKSLKIQKQENWVPNEK